MMTAGVTGSRNIVQFSNQPTKKTGEAQNTRYEEDYHSESEVPSDLRNSFLADDLADQSECDRPTVCSKLSNNRSNLDNSVLSKSVNFNELISRLKGPTRPPILRSDRRVPTETSQ